MAALLLIGDGMECNHIHTEFFSGFDDNKLCFLPCHYDLHQNYNLELEFGINDGKTLHNKYGDGR